jgi:hypothetical protein
MQGGAPHVHVVEGMLQKLREKRQVYAWSAFQEGDRLGTVRARLELAKRQWRADMLCAGRIRHGHQRVQTARARPVRGKGI